MNVWAHPGPSGYHPREGPQQERPKIEALLRRPGKAQPCACYCLSRPSDPVLWLRMTITSVQA